MNILIKMNLRLENYKGDPIELMELIFDDIDILLEGKTAVDKDLLTDWSIIGHKETYED